jgi:hypothetical protein
MAAAAVVGTTTTTTRRMPATVRRLPQAAAVCRARVGTGTSWPPPPPPPPGRGGGAYDNNAPDDHCPVFQWGGACRGTRSRQKPSLPLAEVEDALLATESMLRRQDKQDYFLSIGLDYEKVMRYYYLVVAWNAAWKATGRRRQD